MQKPNFVQTTGVECIGGPLDGDVRIVLCPPPPCIVPKDRSYVTPGNCPGVTSYYLWDETCAAYFLSFDWYVYIPHPR